MAIIGRFLGRKNYWPLVIFLRLLSVSVRIVIPIRLGYLDLHD